MINFVFNLGFSHTIFPGIPLPTMFKSKVFFRDIGAWIFCTRFDWYETYVLISNIGIVTSCAQICSTELLHLASKRLIGICIQTSLNTLKPPLVHLPQAVP